MCSIDNKDTVKRFTFNKPYDFIEFKNCLTSEYLYSHDFKSNAIFWLDYDNSFIGNDSLLEDMDIICKNCIKNNFYFLTLRCDPPREPEEKEQFLKDYSRYISSDLNTIQNTSTKLFPTLLQNILLNYIAEKGAFNENKFVKCCSFLYRDGALMYTLGGIFTDNPDDFIIKYSKDSMIQSQQKDIKDIKIPNITYKEKFYLDSNVSSIELLIKYSEEFLANSYMKEHEYTKKLNEYLADQLEVELSYSDLTNYITNYRFIPQYYEGII